MFKKFSHLQDDLLILFGILFALRLIYTKEIYIYDVFGNTVNTIYLLILTIILVAINKSYKANDEKSGKDINSK